MQVSIIMSLYIILYFPETSTEELDQEMCPL